MQPRPAPFSMFHSDQVNGPKQRFLPIMDFASFDLVGLAHETDTAFDAPVAFGPVTGSAVSACPAEWLADVIETALGGANSLRRTVGPIHISAPSPALSHSDTPRLCEAAVRRARACPQEICLEFEDAAFFDCADEALERVSALRSHGFRVGIDARWSWQAVTTPPLRMLIDSVRVDAHQLDLEADLADRVESVAAEGISVIAEHARWRDAEPLKRAGVCLAVAPRADA